ncbi:MAG: hypothetical protein ACN4EF_04830 [Wenyingzhuangia sp.]|jgi:hypothetical protein|uniref:hypothetical protein n=1 Tax=Wenyingzhuangia sp. TaxID=1964193 RepID=UPI00321B9E78
MNKIMMLLFLALSSCIGEDIVNDSVPEQLRIVSNLHQLRVGDVVKLEASYFNRVGEKEDKRVLWESSDSIVISIDTITTSLTAASEGIATVIAKTSGMSEVLSDQYHVAVLPEKEEVLVLPELTKVGTFAKVSSYASAGDFEVKKTSSGIQIHLASNYVADQSLPGFALFLTNNPNSLANALQIDAYDDEDGAHYKGSFIYSIDDLGLNDYSYLVQWCRPYSILVGQALIIDK